MESEESRTDSVTLKHLDLYLYRRTKSSLSFIRCWCALSLEKEKDRIGAYILIGFGMSFLFSHLVSIIEG